ncbi:hypothetical protein GGQ71_000931 [Rhizobium taibaishanense]|uniref:Uncharacterized protein n=1 Tax=Allorhizobium taibaishanense TaxID=887144 RepID=A0A7W6MT28_9HYPH|nr:hypothetical protein [Allorhizobium taibaishanense]
MMRSETCFYHKTGDKRLNRFTHPVLSERAEKLVIIAGTRRSAS